MAFSNLQRAIQESKFGAFFTKFQGLAGNALVKRFLTPEMAQDLVDFRFGIYEPEGDELLRSKLTQVIQDLQGLLNLDRHDDDTQSDLSANHHVAPAIQNTSGRTYPERQDNIEGSASNHLVDNLSA